MVLSSALLPAARDVALAVVAAVGAATLLRDEWVSGPSFPARPREDYPLPVAPYGWLVAVSSYRSPQRPATRAEWRAAQQSRSTMHAAGVIGVHLDSGALVVPRDEEGWGEPAYFGGRGIAYYFLHDAPDADPHPDGAAAFEASWQASQERQAEAGAAPVLAEAGADPFRSPGGAS